MRGMILTKQWSVPVNTRGHSKQHTDVLHAGVGTTGNTQGLGSKLYQQEITQSRYLPRALGLLNRTHVRCY